MKKPISTAQAEAKLLAQQSAKITAYIASLSKAGRFVRFTFIREIKQAAGIEDARAMSEFEKAVKGGKVMEAGRRGEVILYESKNVENE